MKGDNLEIKKSHKNKGLHGRRSARETEPSKPGQNCEAGRAPGSGFWWLLLGLIQSQVYNESKFKLFGWLALVTDNSFLN